MQEINKPYVYRIKNRITNQFYYGSKYSAISCCYTLFWKNYFTSSPTVHKLNKLYGKESWDIKIIKTYNTPREALLAEQKYIKRCFKSKYSLNLRYFEYNNEYLEDLDPVEKMVMTRKIPNENGVSSYILGGRKTAETKKLTILSDGRSLMQATADKGAELRKKRGDYEKLSQEVSDKGGVCSERKICEFCLSNITLGNYARWHGNNCKMNPDITDEQLKKREPANKGSQKTEAEKLANSLAQQGIVTAYDLENKIIIRLSKEEFDKHKDIKYVGITSKKSPFYKKSEVSAETREKLSKANKGRIVKESTRMLMSKNASERKGLYIWVNNPIINKKTKILKESLEDFLNQNSDWVLGKGKNKTKENDAR